MFTNFSILNLLTFIIIILLMAVCLLVIFVIVLRFYHVVHDKYIKRNLAKWETPIFEYLEGDIKPQAIVNRVPRRKYKFLLKYLRDYLKVLKGEDYTKVASLVNDTNLFNYLIKKSKLNIRRRIDAAYFLGLSRCQRAKPILVKNLKSKSILLFLSSSISLAKLNALDSVGQILTNANRFSRISRDTILSILSEFERSVCFPLTKRLLNEKNDFYKIVIVIILRHFQFHEAANVVQRMIIYERSPEFIIQGIRFLGEIEHFDAVELLRSFFINHPNPRHQIGEY